MKYSYTFLLFIIGCLCSFVSGNAQQNLYFEKYNVKKGLPESSVRDMKEDRQGYIWMATQNGLVRYDGYRYKVYNLGSEKLNRNNNIVNVVNLYLDKQNSLWASTISNGLFKYDRTNDKFEQYVYSQKEDLLYYTILTDDNSGNLWGTVEVDGDTNFVWKLDRKGCFEFFGRKQTGSHNIPASHIYSILNSSEGKIWFGTNNGFYRYEGSKASCKGYLTETDASKTKEAVYLYEPPSQPGIFWMVSYHPTLNDAKIIRFDSKLNTHKEYNPDRKYYSFIGTQKINIDGSRYILGNGIHEDKKRRLWFAGENGLIQLNRNSEKFSYFPNNNNNPTSDALLLFDFKETKEGTFWLSSNKGLVSFDPVTAHFESYLPDVTNKGAINSGDNLISKYLDHSGVLWLGFGWAGANKINKLKSTFTIFQHIPGKEDSYPVDPCNISSGEKGNYWLTADNAVYKWKQGSNSFEKTYVPKKGELYADLTCTRDGNLYVPTTKGLIFYNTKTGKNETYSLNGDNGEPLRIRKVLEDYKGIIWLGTRGNGICSFDPKTKKLTRYPFRQNQEKITAENSGALDDSYACSIYEDRQKNLWIGTNYGGLNLFDRKKGCFSSSITKNKAIVCVTAIYEDKSGRLWVGTYQNGVFVYDVKKGIYKHHIAEKSGLLFNTVFDIDEDSSGQIWVLSERGLSRINPKNWNVKNFQMDNILSGYDIIRKEDLLKLNDGRFAISLKNGMAVFDPKNLEDNPFPPKVNLEEVGYSNPNSYKKEETNVVAYGRKTLELPYDQNRIRFNYIGLQYDNPTENKYAYQLAGYDKDWVQVGTQRTVTYTNLAPGTYVFHVKAANSDGVWSKDSSAITIVISPPWWKTWWAYLIYAIVLMSVVRSYIVYKGRRLKYKNKLLEEKVASRTDELTQSIAELKTTQNQLIQSEKMASLGELTAGIAHEIQNPLNFVNNFSEVSMELLDEMEEEMAKGDTEEARAIAIDIKQNLEKINHHGKRADSIVKGMLQHSRKGNDSKSPTNINALADEFLRLAYHGLRAKDKSFNADLITDFEETLPNINVIPQDLGRVLLNLFTNAFYATHQKQKAVNNGYKPIVTVTTAHKDNGIQITVKDNGMGIPEAIKDKIMQPFFTTKPTGEGTGLGLSLSYDIVVKGHGGAIKIETQEGVGSEFRIQLPAN